MQKFLAIFLSCGIGIAQAQDIQQVVNGGVTSATISSGLGMGTFTGTCAITAIGTCTIVAGAATFQKIITTGSDLTLTITGTPAVLELILDGAGSGGGAGNQNTVSTAGGNTCLKASTAGGVCTTPMASATGAAGSGNLVAGAPGIGTNGTINCDAITQGNPGAPGGPSISAVTTASGGVGGAIAGGAGAGVRSTAGGNAQAGSGGGGGGGGMDSSATTLAGFGGSSGGRCYILINAPAGSYGIRAGTGGAGATAGAGGGNGGTGGDGAVYARAR